MDLAQQNLPPNFQPVVSPTPEQLTPQTTSDKPKKSKVAKILFSFVSILVICSMFATYFFWLAPQAQAKEFIEKTSNAFEEINQKVDSVYQGFTKIKSKLPAAQSSFEEVKTPTRDYNYIKKDTDEDIKDIESVLTLVNEAENELDDLKKPEEVRDLAEKLKTYYTTLETTLDNLLEHQQLNRALIDAHGQELYDALTEFQKYQSGGARTDVINDCQQIASLATEAQVRMKAITKVNPNEQDYYDGKVEFFADLETTYKQAALLYQNVKDNEAEQLLQDFSKRNDDRNNRVQDNCDKYVADSIAARGFLKLPTLEEEVIAEIARLVEKYGLDIDGFKKEATPSAKPNGATSSANP